jgi:hypothetical protein
VARKILKTKLVKCVHCSSSFVGCIDATGRFCSKKCADEHGPIRNNEIIEPNKHSKKYPFNCKKCGILVSNGYSGGSYKSHKKYLCTKKCDGIPRNRGGYPLDRSLKSNRKKPKKSDLTQNSSAPLIEVSVSIQNESKIKTEKYGESFYTQPAWLKLRYEAFKINGRACQVCRSTEVKLHVDHIKPRSKYPELALDINNLQILCEPCNLGKGNWDETDWRQD